MTDFHRESLVCSPVLALMFRPVAVRKRRWKGGHVDFVAKDDLSSSTGNLSVFSVRVITGDSRGGRAAPCTLQWLDAARSPAAYI
jgi:hypothetical protein